MNSIFIKITLATLIAGTTLPAVAINKTAIGLGVGLGGCAWLTCMYTLLSPEENYERFIGAFEDTLKGLEKCTLVEHVNSLAESFKVAIAFIPNNDPLLKQAITTVFTKMSAQSVDKQAIARDLKQLVAKTETKKSKLRRNCIIGGVIASASATLATLWFLNNK